MSYIYKITNTINGKIYIGQTSYSIESRFIEHCEDMHRRQCEKRPLYAAMQKYGIENFRIEMIEECPQEEVQERERYWISIYDSYHKGYNATKGGDGRLLYDHEAIVNRLKEYPYATEVAKEFGCCPDLTRELAKLNNIKLENRGNDNFKQLARVIYQYSKDKKQLLNQFESTAEAARWCFENKYANTLTSGVRSHIADVANGKRKSAYGFVWSYTKV